MMTRRVVSCILAIGLFLIPVAVAAQEDLTADVVTSVDCNDATFLATVSGGSGPYDLLWDFGDTETDDNPEVSGFPIEIKHTYPAPGDYKWQLFASDSLDVTAEADGAITIDGPAVVLASVPFPPLVVLESGEAVVDFSAEVSGGEQPYTFSWDLDGDGLSDSDESVEASFTYTEAGKYLASVRVTDNCELMGEAVLPVVVIDPDEEACHPMAQRIADGVNSLFPAQAESLYTCEDIYDIFRGGLTGSQTGFGRLWHAYKLAETIQDLTWEEIRDWHLDGNGWGGLVQLNRFADLLDQHGIQELVELVISGEASINEIRHSVRSVVRYEADFEDALARLGDGISPGELGRFYRTAQDLQLAPDQLDAYLTDGTSLQELNHAARLAERSDSDWTQVIEAHAAGHSWGAIGQAQRMAEDSDWSSILEVGIRETRDQKREDDRTEREQGRIDRTAEQLAARYGVSAHQVLDLYHVECEQDWSCLRKALRDQTETSAASDQVQKITARLAKQYGLSESQVRALYDGSCGGSWSCVRAQLRNDSGKGPKPKD
ncbi:MAG: PKD domain-containing protein [Anaerolineales bacterium]